MSHSRRRLLVVSYHFPPDGAVGGLRWAGITQHLQPLGWQSVVLTAAPASKNGRAPHVSVRRCAPLPTLNDLYNRVRFRQQAAAVQPAGVPTSANGRGPSSGILNRLRREASVALAMPDEGRGWILRAARATRSLIRSWNPDVVVSTGPPHSAHIATWLATRGMGVRWITDLRDPWAWPFNKTWELSRMFDVWFVRKTMEVMERKAILASSTVIANSRWLKEALEEKYGRGKIVWLPNGFDLESIPAKRPEPFPGLGIAHVGTMYGKRDIIPVVHALAEFLERNPAARSDGTKLRLAGNIEGTRPADLKRAVQERKLEPYVELLGVVPRAEALDILLRSRVCIVLAQGQMVEIPAKLQEAIGAGIPAVVLAPAGSASVAEAERIGAIHVDERQTGGLTEIFEAVARGELRVPEEQIQRVSYAGIAREFLTVLDA